MQNKIMPLFVYFTPPEVHGFYGDPQYVGGGCGDSGETLSPAQVLQHRQSKHFRSTFINIHSFSKFCSHLLFKALKDFLHKKEGNCILYLHPGCTVFHHVAKVLFCYCLFIHSFIYFSGTHLQNIGSFVGLGFFFNGSMI